MTERAVAAWSAGSGKLDRAVVVTGLGERANYLFWRLVRSCLTRTVMAPALAGAA